MATRVTVTVPDELRGEMRRLNARVNWSRVATQAFEVKVGEYARKQKELQYADVVDRLRRSKFGKETYVGFIGKNGGYEWARGAAEAHHLERLAEARNNLGYGWVKYFDSENRSDIDSAGYQFFSIIEPDSRDCHKDSAAFWEEQLDGKLGMEKDAVFVRAFAEGALALWGEVVDKL